jgi:hypothetical protein
VKVLLCRCTVPVLMQNITERRISRGRLDACERGLGEQVSLRSTRCLTNLALFMIVEVVFS